MPTAHHFDLETVLLKLMVAVIWGVLFFVIGAMFEGVLIMCASSLAEKLNAPMAVQRFFDPGPEGPRQMLLFHVLNFLPVGIGLFGAGLAAWSKLPGTRITRPLE